MSGEEVEGFEDVFFGSAEGEIPLLTLDSVPGKTTLSVKGLVRGSSVQAKSMWKSVGSAFKGMRGGGELTNMTDLLSQTQVEALSRMRTEAQAIGATAVVGVRLIVSPVGDSTAVVAYGTAVVTRD